MTINEQKIWVSTPEHFKAFTKIHQENSWLRKLLGLYNIPVGFPYLEGIGIITPLIYQQKCYLSIDNNEISIQPNPDYNSFWIRNLIEKPPFKLPFHKINEVSIIENDAYRFSPFNRNKWLKVNFSKQNGEQDEMLLCGDAKATTHRNSTTENIFNILSNTLVTTTDEEE